MTRSMPSTWMPRAAMSVATMTRTAPDENDARLRSRALWARLPCSSVAGARAMASWRASLRAPCLVLVKISDRLLPPARAATTPTRSAGAMVSRWWTIAGGLRGGVDGMLGRVVQETADEHVDGVVERRGEEHPLAVAPG